VSVRPVLIVNPRSDVRFGELVAKLTEDVPTSPAELEAQLRAEFPSTIVRRRELSSEPTEVWYVYRDGRWTPD
jgi:DNA-binding HxlR family transcriptional regulator